MSALRPMSHASPSRLETLRCWQILENGEHVEKDLGDVATLEEALASQGWPGLHKAHFFIQVTSAHTGITTNHYYVVKQKARQWRYDPETKVTRQYRDLYPCFLFKSQTEIMKPVERWRVKRDTVDFVGIDRNLIEVRHA